MFDVLWRIRAGIKSIHWLLWFLLWMFPNRSPGSNHQQLIIRRLSIRNNKSQRKMIPCPVLLIVNGRIHLKSTLLISEIIKRISLLITQRNLPRHLLAISTSCYQTKGDQQRRTIIRLIPTLKSFWLTSSWNRPTKFTGPTDFKIIIPLMDRWGSRPFVRPEIPLSRGRPCCPANVAVQQRRQSKRPTQIDRIFTNRHFAILCLHSTIDFTQRLSIYLFIYLTINFMMRATCWIS